MSAARGRPRYERTPAPPVPSPSRQLALQRRWQAQGRCTQCGQRRDGRSRARCVACLVRARVRERRAKGVRAWQVGGPGRPPLENAP